MYTATVWWPRVDPDMFRAELGCMQRLACVSIAGSVRMALMAALEVLLSHTPPPTWCHRLRPGPQFQAQRYKSVVW
jgi:hypothetical protein